MNAQECINEEKARELSEKLYSGCKDYIGKRDLFSYLMSMAQWKDEQYKIAYIVTRIDLHYDEVEKVFFDKSKAEEYCKSFNEDENGYHRNITKIEVSL